jgi:hypothetical protein
MMAQKFCTTCGAKLVNEKFCTNCGNAVTADEGENKEAPKKNLIVYGKALVGIIVVVCIIIGAYSIMGRSSNKLVKEFVKAYTEKDAEKLIELMPEKFINYIEDEKYNGNRSSMISEFKLLYLNDLNNTGADTDAKNISYKINDVGYLEDYDLSYIEAKTGKISRCVKIKLSLIDKDSGDKIKTMEIMAIKRGNSWYWLYDTYLLWLVL